MVETALLGFPRIGPNRELKRALERCWSGRTSVEDLDAAAKSIRREQIVGAANAGVDVIPCNDFSLYDHVLDTAVMVGAVPARFAAISPAGHERYFAMARGTAAVKPLEMTKWFDTNYHYLVPEIDAGTKFALHAGKVLTELRDAREWGVRARPVVLGPMSFLLLAKSRDSKISVPALLDRLVPIYEELLATIANAGATEVQIDEPCLVTDLTDDELTAFERAWRRLVEMRPDLLLTLTTYFGTLGQDLDRIFALPAAAFHLDIVRGPQQLAEAVGALSSSAQLSLGVIDGRNVWIADLESLIAKIEPVIERLGSDRVRIAPSCSLLHVPYSARREARLDARVRPWLAFGQEKIDELQLLKAALRADHLARRELIAANRAAVTSRRTSTLIHDAAVGGRHRALRPQDLERQSPYARRAELQAERLRLPELPTTTIGSFPQTPEIRDARRRHDSAALSTEEYEAFLRDQIRSVIAFQDRLGFDVLVHGESERNDMVQYFAEQLEGFVISAHGWVQSYGSRCVKPPILFGDVSRPRPMTVRWWRHAQSCTDRPVKGMLTGPVTILQWSFVRDDQPRSVTCQQIAFAIRDEALDLEAAGAQVIQIDEAALREGLPLRRAEQEDYVRWAVDCFRLAANGVGDETQLHSHMCYSEFNEMIEHIARMDADVISIEASRSQMDLLDSFRDFQYPNAIGPGVYDIHSPRVPTAEEIVALLREAETRLPREQLWVNPDCGLKTRRWEDVIPALEHLVAAARAVRSGTPVRA